MSRRTIRIGIGCVLIALLVVATLQARGPRESVRQHDPVDHSPDLQRPKALEAAPPQSTLTPTPLSALPSQVPSEVEPVPVAPVESEPVEAESVTMPTATGIAVFDDGRPVAGASFRVTSAGDRVVLAVGSTDDEGRFTVTVPGHGAADYWFDDHGIRFRVLAALRDAARIVVPTFSVRIEVEPTTQPAIVTLVAPDDDAPVTMRLDGVERPPAPPLEYADAIDKRFGGRQVPVTGNVDLRLPIVRRLVLWASSADTNQTSNVVEIPEPSTLGGPVVLTLSPTVSMMATVTMEGASSDRSIRVATFGPLVPAQSHTLAASGGSLRGLIAGKRYRLRSETEDVDVVEPTEFVAVAGGTLDVRAKELVATRFEVVDASGDPVVGARVRIGVLPEDPASRMGRASWVGGTTNEKGVWVGHSFPWGHARGSVAPPPGSAVTLWQGDVRAGGTYKITLAPQEPFTALRVRPPDCIVRVTRGDFMWLLPGNAPIPLAVDDSIEITSGGRYVRKRVRARELPPGTAELQLEKAVRFEVVAPDTVASLRFFQGGGMMFIDEAFVARTGPGRFEVTGLAAGVSVGVVGRCGTPERSCTERTEFVVRDGGSVVLKETGRDAGGKRAPPR